MTTPDFYLRMKAAQPEKEVAPAPKDFYALMRPESKPTEEPKDFYAEMKPEVPIVPTKPTEPEIKDWKYWVKHSEDPQHPFKRALKEHPAEFAQALAIGSLAGQEAYMRGGRQSGEFEGVPALDLFGLFGVKKPETAEKISAVDRWRESAYKTVKDPEIKEILDSAEMLGSFISLDPVIRAGGKYLNKAAETISFVNQVSKDFNVPKSQVWKKWWDITKEKYGWGKPKIDPKTGATIVMPEQIENMAQVAKESPEVIIGEVVKPELPKETAPIVARSPELVPILEKPVEVKPEPIVEAPNQAEVPKPVEPAPIKPKPAIVDPEKPKEVAIPEVTSDLASGAETKKRVPLIQETMPRQPEMGTKQAAKRSDIIELFRKAFNDPIRLKKFRKRAQGIHKGWAKVSRLLHDNDIEAAAHEIGHNLHYTLYGGDAKLGGDMLTNVINALSPYLDELKPIARYEPFTLEGFAEFTRMYVTNPDVAKKLAPRFYTKFEADLTAQYPELKNALLDAREYYERYLKGTPESRIDSMTSYGEDQSKLDNMIDWVKDKGNLDRLKTELLDDVFPAKRAVAEAFGIPTSEVENLKDSRNLYRTLRVLKGAVGKADVFALHETFSARTLDKINGSLRDILKELKKKSDYREFNRYLLARRALEKSAQNVSTGINFGDAKAVFEKLDPRWKGLAAKLDQYNDSVLQYARDSGLLSDESYKQIKKKNLLYVPFQRDLKKDKPGVASAGGRIQAGKPIKRMFGSTRDIIAPLESVLKNTYTIIVNAEKNMAGQVLANLGDMKNMGKYIERVPTPMKLMDKVTKYDLEKATIKHLEQTGQTQFLEMKLEGDTIVTQLREEYEDLLPDLIKKWGPTTYPAGENIVTVYFDGKPRYYEVSPEISEMWSKGLQPYTAGLITKILRIPARTLRAGAILNPKFIQKNFVRDTWGGILFTKYGKSIKDPVGLFLDTVYSPLAMMAQAARKGPLYVEWLKSGGGMSTMQSLDRASVVKKLKEVRDGYKPWQVMKWLRQVAEISEEANRLAEFGRALKVEGQTRLGREVAAFASRDLSIDFAKIGLQTKALNQIIPFYNATIQGGDKLLRTLGSDKDRTEFIIRGISTIVLPALIFAWLNRNDDRVKEFQEQEKDFNFITFIGDTAVKIPVPFETGVLLNGFTQRMFNYMMTKDPEAFEGFMGSIWSAMAPNFIPALANPFIETQCNKNFFTGARIIPAAKEGLIAKYQYGNYSSTTARLLGRGMAYMLGQETRSKAASPAIIDHFVNSWGGGLGRLMISISDMSLEAVGLGDKIPKPGQSIIEKLGLDAFKARYPRASTASIEKFYDNYTDAMTRKKSYKQAEKLELETPKEIEEGYQRMEKIYDLYTLERARKALQRCQREINNIFNDPSIDKDVKKQMIDDLYLEMIEFARCANADIKQYRLSQKN